ncbi:hypothetical protein C8Q76DRAFT_860707 [Earliella scabrosa]|nr:hypothetical protein C8Q76DRAFT_860707 [Earliella scabrosa]
MIGAILDSVSSGHVLHTIRIHLDHLAFYTARAGLLTTICGEHVVEGIRRLRSYGKLRQLAFTFHENDPKYNELWWREQILLRLADDSQGPDFSVSVNIDRDVPGLGKRLWYTPTQHVLADRLEQSKQQTIAKGRVKDDSVLYWDYETLSRPPLPGHRRWRRRWSTNDVRFPGDAGHQYFDIPNARPILYGQAREEAEARSRAVLHGAGRFSYLARRKRANMTETHAYTDSRR